VLLPHARKGSLGIVIIESPATTCPSSRSSSSSSSKRKPPSICACPGIDFLARLDICSAPPHLERPLWVGAIQTSFPCIHSLLFHPALRTHSTHPRLAVRVPPVTAFVDSTSLLHSTSPILLIVVAASCSVPTLQARLDHRFGARLHAIGQRPSLPHRALHSHATCPRASARHLTVASVHQHGICLPSTITRAQQRLARTSTAFHCLPD
jgi:hypothetical protein